MKTQQNKENDIPLDNHNTMSNINNDYVDNGKEELNTPLLSSSSSSSSSSSTSLQHHNNNDNNNNVMNTMTTQSNNVSTTFFHHIITIYTNQSPSTSTLFQGLSFIFILGTILGTIMPKNPNLSSMIYQYISSIIGYTYFICWSVSFYPQIITNYKNKSTLGLSVDGSLLAVLNYICYSIYNVFFYFDDTIRDEYKHRYNHHNGHEEEEEGSDITVMSNDVAFALNALFLTIIIVLQIIYYNHKKNRFNHNNNEGSIVAQPLLPISKSCWWIIVMTIGISLIQVFCILIKVHGFLWIDFLYFMGGVKLILTIMTYIPQIMLNFQRKSTDGEYNNIMYMNPNLRFDDSYHVVSFGSCLMMLISFCFIRF